MIEVKGLTKYYGDIAAITDVSFSVAQGEIIGFLGPNGAGKSTTMRILTGFSPASRGTARIAGFEVHAEPLEVKRRVGYLPERVPLYEEMVVCSFLKYVAEIKGVRGRNGRQLEAERVMDQCGLRHMSARTIGNLSKGYRQRVGLAQALIGSPEVLVLDEPTVGLDPKQIVDIRKMIRSLGQAHTVLISTHILPEVSMVCDRVVIIDRGRVVAEDSMENLAGAGDAPRLRLEVAGPREQVLKTLNAMDCVAGVEPEQGEAYSVVCAPGSAQGGQLTRALVEAGLSVLRVEPLRRTLEDVFMEVVAGDRADAAGAGGAEDAA